MRGSKDVDVLLAANSQTLASVSAGPVAAGPEARPEARPEPTGPVAARPEATKPGARAVASEASGAEASEPEAAGSVSTRSEATKPGASEPEATGAVSPGTEATEAAGAVTTSRTESVKPAEAGGPVCGAGLGAAVGNQEGGAECDHEDLLWKEERVRDSSITRSMKKVLHHRRGERAYHVACCCLVSCSSD